MSQFRRDPVSGDWIILAPERARRPEEMLPKRKRQIPPKSKCPFEDLQKSGNWPPILEYDERGLWQAIILPNKFPALTRSQKSPAAATQGPYRLLAGVGYHELLVTRDHTKNFGDISPRLAAEVFKLFAERYRSIDSDRLMVYLSIFGNWGPTAGASIGHPHYQLMALPVLPPGVARSYNGSENYFKKHKRCIHCEILHFEQRAKVRIIAENSAAIALAPFTSRQPYEVKIFPKEHVYTFEHSSAETLAGTAEMLQDIVRRVRRRLADPDYNFYIHTAPLREANYKHYHWHIEFVPRISTLAGFEYATGIDVNVVTPEAAAKILR